MQASPKAPLRVDSNEAIGSRLRLLRIAYGNVQGRSKELNQSDFGRMVGMTPQAVNNVEGGDNRLGLDNALRIRLKLNVPLDFLYVDSRLGLPGELRREIERLERLEEQAAQPARQARKKASSRGS